MTAEIGTPEYCREAAQCLNFIKAYSPKRTKQPSLRTLEKWSQNGVARATDGCKVEPDGVCPHGCKSWLLELGVI